MIDDVSFYKFTNDYINYMNVYCANGHDLERT